MTSNRPSNLPTDPRKALVIMRVIWAAILVGMLVYLGVVLAIKEPPNPQSDLASTFNILFYINCGLLFVGLFVGYTLRNQFYKKHWVGEVVLPQGYFQGNLLLWAIAEGNAFFSLTIVLLAGSFDPYIWPAVGAAASITTNFPTGHIMFPPRENLT